MVAFTVGQTEEALLENGILAVPEGKRKAQSLFFVGQTGNAVFAPAIGSRSGMVVSKIVPGIAAFAVIFPDGTPLSFTQIWSPSLPCSYSATSLPSASGVSRSAKIVLEGRFPSNTR